MEDKVEKTKQTIPMTNPSHTNSKQVDRVALNKDVIARIDNWISQIQKNAKAVRVTKSDVASFVLMALPMELSATQIEALQKRHFDDVAFSFWLARTLKKARTHGENTTLDELYRQYALAQSQISER